MKKRVICDMNVWYGIAEGRINIEDHQGVDLIAPGTNIIEFASTENFFSNLDLVKKALQALHDYGQFINYDAFDYIITHYVDYDFKPDQDFFMKQIREFELLIDDKIDGYFEHAENIRSFNERIEEINAPAQKFADGMTAILPKIRKQGRAEKGSTKAFNASIIDDNDSYKHIVKLIREIIAQKTGVDENELIGKIKYDNFELLFLVWDAFLTNKITSGGGGAKNAAKVKINDIYDLTNLAYVGQNDLYWTEDKYWLKLIYQNPTTRKYIYNLDSPHLPNTEESNSPNE